MKNISTKTIDRVSELCLSVKQNEELIRDTQRTAEQSVKAIEACIRQTEDPDLIQKYAVLVFSESLYWLDEKAQWEMEQFIYPLLRRLRLSPHERHRLLSEVRQIAKETHSDFTRYLAVAWKARDIFLGALDIRLPFPD